MFFWKLNDQTFKNCIIQQKRKPGFVHLKVSGYENVIPTHRKINKDFFIDNDGFLLPYKIKENIIKPGNKISNKMLDELERKQELLFNKLKTRIKLKYSNGQVTKATTQMLFELIEDSSVLGLSLDIAAVLKLNHSSKYITNWSKRNRVWPDLKDLEEELSESYIIAKPSNEEKFNVRTREFRYSFSHIERKIVSLQSIEQRLTYYVAKIIFYQWLKPFDDEKLQSFFLKNTMLWICEEFPPHDKMWDYVNVLNSTKYLYAKLLGYMKKRFMPYYFIPEVNVFGGLYPELYDKVNPVLECIMKDLPKYIPNHNKTKKKVQTILDFFSKFLPEFRGIYHLYQKSKYFKRVLFQ